MKITGIAKTGIAAIVGLVGLTDIGCARRDSLMVEFDGGFVKNPTVRVAYGQVTTCARKGEVAETNKVHGTPANEPYADAMAEGTVTKSGWNNPTFDAGYNAAANEKRR